MMKWLVAGVILPFALARGSAGVIVIGNYTAQDVAITIAEPGEKPRPQTIPAFHVVPVVVNGPADLKLPIEGKNAAVRVDPATPYLIIPDRVAKLRIEGVAMPGKPPERDARPEAAPIARNPVKIPVTLLVDDVDPRADMLWQRETRQRFDAAAAIIEAQTGFKFEFAGFDSWKSNPDGKDPWSQLLSLEDQVKVKPGSIAIGFTSRKLDDELKEFGACRGIGASHILVREWKPKGDSEQVEVLVRYMAISLGAVSSPDPGSAMRPKLGDEQAQHTGYVIRLDPLNVLALNLLADQRRLGVTQLAAAPEADRVRLARVYGALLQAFPADALAVDYLNALDKDAPKGPNPGKRTLAQGGARRTEAVKQVVRAVADRARGNTGPSALRGDALTAALLAAAADAAQRLDESERVSAFLIGIGVALDDRDSLRNDPFTSAAVADVETEAERQDRVAALENPTLRGRRDLCRRFVVGCAVGELLTPAAAQDCAIARSAFDLIRPNYAAGFSFPALSADLAGIALSHSLRENPEAVFQRIRSKFSAADFAPDPHGLRDCIGPEKFEEAFGDPADERFRAMLVEIQKRVQALPVNRPGP